MKYAEDVNYWKTSKSGIENWIDRIVKEIEKVNGVIHSQLYGEQKGKAGFIIQFSIKEDSFRLYWPVLEPYCGDLKAAKVQAVTALYHEVKAACVKAKFLGVKNAFIGYLILPNGDSIHEAVENGLDNFIPEMIKNKSLPKPDNEREEDD